MERLAISESLASKFDFDIARSDEPFKCFDLTEVCSTDFMLGVVVGPSGSGKTQAMANVSFDMIQQIEWSDDYGVADHFMSEEEAIKSLSGAGLNSVPQWFKPIKHLSNGEQYRANFARVLAYVGQADRDHLVCVDEFTSVVDRTVARSLCESLTRFLKPSDRMVLSTCHYDVLNWLSPDWVLDTATNTVSHGEHVHKKSWEVHVFDKVGCISR